MRFSRSTHLLMYLPLETLTSITRTGLPILVELINLVIWNDLTQMVNFPTPIPDCDSHCPALLDLFISSDASIYLFYSGFASIAKFWSCCFSISIDFPSNSQRNAPFHRIAYDYSCAAWDDLHDHLKDVPWKDIFKLSASAAAKEVFDVNK